MLGILLIAPGILWRQVHVFGYRKIADICLRNIEIVSSILVLTLGIASILLSVKLNELSDQINEQQIKIAAAEMQLSDFATKNDLINVYLTMQKENLPLARQGFVQAKLAVINANLIPTRPLANIEKESETKISGLNDYVRIVNVEKILPYAQQNIAAQSYKWSELRRKQSQLFSLLIITNGISGAFAFLGVIGRNRRLEIESALLG